MTLLLEEKLSPLLRRDLTKSLNTDDRWRVIIDRLQTYRIPVFLNVQRMNELVRRGMSPADWVIEELFNRMCSYEEFCFMLREFDLLEELELLTPPEPMVIEEQPGNGKSMLFLNEGGMLRLTCKAIGVPRPTYQWHHYNNPLPGKTGPILSIEQFSKEHIGSYWCRVTQVIHNHVSDRMSKEVVVDLMYRRPELTMDLPCSRSVLSGHCFTLAVEARGYPPPSYEWYRSSAILDNGSVDTEVMPNIVLQETSNILELRNITPDDEGLYCCRAYNKAGQTLTNICKLSVFEEPPQIIASAKLALLIGNEDYEDDELKGLTAPSNDVVTLAHLLESLGFHVIALHNLSRSEMFNALHWFRRVLPENAYAFFFFAGHGFLKLSSKFMMPIDCPKDGIQLHHCLCNEHVTQILADGKQLQLLVMLFDSCLIESRDLSVGETEFEYNVGNCNIVIGTATRNHQRAYESESDANSMFVDHLREYITVDKPIFELLRDMQKEFRQKVQQPSLYTEGADNCKLTDPVVEHPELQEILRSQIEFSAYEQDLHFTRVNQRVTVNISKHKNCFLNSIDLRFPEGFPYTFVVELGPDVAVKHEKGVVIICNVQKVKAPLTVRVSIVRMTDSDNILQGGPVDCCSFTINSPVIERGQLWQAPEKFKLSPKRASTNQHLLFAKLLEHLNINW